MSILNRLRLNSHLDDAAIAAIWTDSTLERHRARRIHISASVPPAGRASPCSRHGSTSFATMPRPKPTSSSRRAPGRAARADLPPPRSARNARRASSRSRRFRAPLTSRTSHASRWIAAAAAAGLIVGVGVGQVMDLRHIGSGSPAHVQARLSRTAAAGRRSSRRPRRSIATGGEDEAFLSDLDASLSRPSVPELRAIDELTPRAGDHATVAVATSQPLDLPQGPRHEGGRRRRARGGLPQRDRRRRPGRATSRTTPAG